MLCLEPGCLATAAAGACLTERPSRRRPPYAVAPSSPRVVVTIKSFYVIRGQGTEGSMGRRLQMMSGAYFSSRDAARRLEGCCFSVSESAA